MDVTLPPDLAERVAELVESGYYPSPAEAIRAALAALDYQLDQEERLAELRDDIDEGLADIAAGRCRPLDEAAVRDILTRAGVTPAATGGPG